MKKSIRNLILGAAMAIGVFAASLSAFAGQFVQDDMSFRSGASTTSTIIGSVPAGGLPGWALSGGDRKVCSHRQEQQLL